MLSRLHREGSFRVCKVFVGKVIYMTLFMASICVLLVSTAFAVGPIVSNVEVVPDQASKRVAVSYRVDDQDSSFVHVSVTVSTNGGQTFDLPAVTFLPGSAVGPVSPGGGTKQLYWDAATDWPGQVTDRMRLRVMADDSVPNGMVVIPGGTNIGTDPDFGAYSLTVEAFVMDKYEVTKGLWDGVYSWAITNGYSFDNIGSGKTAGHPVHTINWYDSVKWCNARSQQDGREPVYYTDVGLTQVYRTGQVAEPNVKDWADGYRLPTSEQWQYAARGGVSGRRFPWGDTIGHSQANYYSTGEFSYDVSSTSGFHPLYSNQGTPFTAPAGAFPPNGFGLFEMSGNVWEQCYNWHGDPAGGVRAIRGGGWNGYTAHADRCRVGFQTAYFPGAAEEYTGFRAVAQPPKPEPPYPAGGDPAAVDWVVLSVRWVKNIYADGAITLSDRDTSLMWVYNAAASGLLNHGDGRNYCDNLVYGGHDDWTMPDRYQLQPMYLHKSLFINVRETLGSAYDWYWSSTGSYVVHMANGALGTAPEYNRHWIWPCRAF